MSFSIKTFLQKNYLAIIICIFAIFGFIASFTLTIDKIDTLKNPNTELECNINSIFNCSTVMQSSYAEVFGIPWSLLGVAGYAGIFVVGLFYINNKKTNVILSYLISLGIFGAFSLSIYFMWVSAYLIGMFCPWCILSAVSSTSIFFAILTISIEEDNLKLPAKLTGLLQSKIKERWNIWFVIIFFFLAFLTVWLPFYLPTVKL